MVARNAGNGYESMHLNWILIVWSMVAAVSFTLAATNFLVWFSNREARANLYLSLTASAVSVMALLEFLMMCAETPTQYGVLVRWMHVPAWVIILSMTAFTLTFMRAGRPWLAWTVCILRTLALLINFLVEPNISFREITGLRHVTFLGESVTVAVGVASPWALFAQLSLLLFVIFLADAAISVWRRGDRRLALVAGGGNLFFIFMSSMLAILVIHKNIDVPFTVSFFFIPILLAMTYAISRDLLHTLQLTTQVQESEAALRLSERRYEDAAEAAEVGAWEWDVVRDDIWITNQGRALFGFDSEQRISYDAFLTVVCPEDRSYLREAVSHSLQIGGSFEREYRIVLPDVGQRWISTRGRVEKDASGKPSILRGLSFNITKRKTSEAYFQQVVHVAPIGIILLDTQGRIMLVNPQAESIFGYSSAELADQPIELLIPERFRTRHALDRRGYFASPSERLMAGREVSGKHKNGSEIPVEIGLSPLPASDKSGAAVLATITDVSERKHAMEVLRAEKAFLRQVIDVTPNLIFSKNRQGQFTMANKAVADIYGTTVDSLIGKSDADFDSHVDEVTFFHRADFEVMDTRQELFIPEERITDASGKLRWLQTIKRPILDQDGNVNQVLGSSADITYRKSMELELDRQRNELAHLSRVTMLSELSGSLAHELNQPLAAILSNAQAALRFLKEDQPDLHEVRDILLDIVKDDKRAGEVIRGLRLLLKKGERRSDMLDVNDVVRDVLRLVNSDILNAGVNLSVSFAPALPQIAGDIVQLQQVIINLVVNGCDAMVDNAAGERKLAISTGRGDDESIQIVVTDQGKGILAEDIERVFEPFYTTKKTGLGLGLAVCRQIVAAHGGRLWCTSGPGRGTTFFLAFPPGAMGAV